MPTDAQYHRLLPAFGRKAMCRGLGVSVVCVKFCKSDQGAWKGFFTQGVILTTATGAGETALLRRSALAGPVVNNASALFKSLEITPHFFLMRCVRGLSGRQEASQLGFSLLS